jgi:hypothetical protein
MRIIPLAHFEERYLVREDGNIISTRSNQFIKPSLNPNGYLKFTFCRDGLTQQKSIHRIVAEHFLPNPYHHSQVNHIDGNKINNVVSNLEWCSATHNNNHALKIGLRPGFMSMDDRLALIERVLAGEIIGDLAEEVGRGRESLSGMLRRAADASGQRDAWNSEMRRRRRDAAIRNLAKINA